jgi:hypothetical protein
VKKAATKKVVGRKAAAKKAAKKPAATKGWHGGQRTSRQVSDTVQPRRPRETAGGQRK